MYTTQLFNSLELLSFDTKQLLKLHRLLKILSLSFENIGITSQLFVHSQYTNNIQDNDLFVVKMPKISANKKISAQIQRSDKTILILILTTLFR